MAICHCDCKKGNSPTMVSGSSPGAFDPNPLQAFLMMEYLLFYGPQPIKFLSLCVSGTNQNHWGQFEFILHSLISNWAVL